VQQGWDSAQQGWDSAQHGRKSAAAVAGLVVEQASNLEAVMEQAPTSFSVQIACPHAVSLLC
jgi:hypothetical protein